MSFIKYIETQRELRIMGELKKRQFSQKYDESSDDIKKVMDKNPESIINGFNEMARRKTQERILNNILFFFWLTIISLIISIAGVFLAFA